MAWTNHAVVSMESWTYAEDWGQKNYGGGIEWSLDRHKNDIGSLFDTEQFVTHNMHTGERSFGRVGGTQTPFAFPTPPHTSLRMGLWYYPIALDISTAFFSSIYDAIAGENFRAYVLVDSRGFISIQNRTGDTGGAFTVYDRKFIAETKLARAYEWVHLGFTKSADYSSFYINGELTLSVGFGVNMGQWIMPRHNVNANISYLADDFYVDVSTDAEADAAPPPYKFQPFRIKAQGSSEQWSNTDESGQNAYTLAKSGEDTNQYLFAAAADLVDYYPTTHILTPEPHTDLYGVGAHIYGDFDDRSADLRVESGGNVLGQEVNKFDTGYIAPGAVFYTAPDGSAWDWDKFKAAQVGIRSR